MSGGPEMDRLQRDILEAWARSRDPVIVDVLWRAHGAICHLRVERATLAEALARGHRPNLYELERTS